MAQKGSKGLLAIPQATKTSIVKSDNIMYKKSDIALSILPAIENIRKQGKLCDVTLLVNNCYKYFGMLYNILW